MTTNIIIRDLEIQFVSKKVNNYNTMISYFKIIDPNVHKKLKPVFKLSESLFKPIWKSEDLWMLKSKYSHIEKTIMEKNQIFKIDLVLVSFNDVDSKDVVKGYYARLNNMIPIAKEEKEKRVERVESESD